MYFHWKALLTLGAVFWGLVYMGDLLGESTWKRCSQSFDDLLRRQYKDIVQMEDEAKQNLEISKQTMSWPVIFWNICAFLCALIFCSMLRSFYWFVYKILKFYNVIKNRKALTDKVEHEANSYEVIFTNQQFCKLEEHQKLNKELEGVKKEKEDLTEQLMMAQKENLTARQQIEEYKMESFMMKDKLARTADSLKENLKFKDFATANQEMISKKAQNLELHLKEVCRDRDLLRSKLCSMEKNRNKLEEKLRLYQKQDSDTNMEQFPVKESEVSENEDKFQQKIMELQRNISPFETKNFEANSKISMDLEDLHLDLMKDSQENIDIVKQNLLNYNAYKAQMLRPKLDKSSTEKMLMTPDSCSSSDDNIGAPQRIISSTVEFQNFLKTLNSKTSLTRNGLF